MGGFRHLGRFFPAIPPVPSCPNPLARFVLQSVQVLYSALMSLGGNGFRRKRTSAASGRQAPDTAVEDERLDAGFPRTVHMQGIGGPAQVLR